MILLLLFEAMVLLLFVVMILYVSLCDDSAVVRDMAMLFGTMVWLLSRELFFL